MWIKSSTCLLTSECGDVAQLLWLLSFLLIPTECKMLSSCLCAGSLRGLNYKESKMSLGVNEPWAVTPKERGGELGRASDSDKMPFLLVLFSSLQGSLFLLGRAFLLLGNKRLFLNHSLSFHHLESWCSNPISLLFSDLVIQHTVEWASWDLYILLNGLLGISTFYFCFLLCFASFCFILFCYHELV